MISEMCSLGTGNHRIGIQVARFSMMRSEGIWILFMKVSNLQRHTSGEECERVCVCVCGFEENINSCLRIEKMNTKIKERRKHFFCSQYS